MPYPPRTSPPWPQSPAPSPWTLGKQASRKAEIGGNLKPKNNESNRQPLYLVPLYKECWYGYYFWSIKNAKRHQTKRETRVSYSKCLVIFVLILHYCFYLRPASNHPFNDRPEYSTHLCMIGSRFINPHFPAVLCKCFPGLEGCVCSSWSFSRVLIRRLSAG